MNLSLRIWRQKNTDTTGRFVTYPVNDVTPDMSFLEMLDVLNEGLIERGEEPVAFEHDCREGICGSCGFLINGIPHGGRRHTTVCQLHMRFFKDGDALTLEPWRAEAFPVVRDLVVDRSAFDRIIQAGGYISAPTGSAPDANDILVPKEAADTAFDAAACIGCGACVAACPNASAMLFTSAKVTHLNARRCAPRESHWSSSHGSIETWSGRRSGRVGSRCTSTARRLTRHTRKHSHTGRDAPQGRQYGRAGSTNERSVVIRVRRGPMGARRSPRRL
jgi:succinate dehydrogenase / fumarate reductase, iron-sulfur subunit